MNRRSLDGPRETKQSDRKARRGVQQEPQSRFILSSLVLRLGSTLLDVPADSRNEKDPSKNVSHSDWNKCQSDLDGAKVPLLVDEGQRLDEHEDQSVGETGEQRQDQDNGLCQEHLEGSGPCLEHFFRGESVLERDELVRSPHVGVTILPSLLCDPVHHDGSPGFRNREEMKGLDSSTEDELNPNRPRPIQVGFAEATNNGTENGTADRGEDDESYGVLLIVSLPQIRNHAQGDGASRRRETAKRSTNHDGGEVGGQSDGKLPDVDEEEGELEDGPSPELF